MEQLASFPEINDETYKGFKNKFKQIDKAF